MHFVTGGNFNGKSAWVKKQYPEAAWISAYSGEDLQQSKLEINADIVVLEGIEYWILKLASEIGYPSIREFVYHVLEVWSDWESQADLRQVIVIGTDITKGVVPIEKEKRAWRDVTGWVYQDIVVRSKRVDLIWYGLQQTLKNEEQ